MKKQKEFNYNSIHDYLNEMFGHRDVEPSPLEITQAKKAYWRLYNSNLKRERRRVIHNINLSLSKREFKLLKKEAKRKKIDLYQLLKERVIQESPNSNMNRSLVGIQKSVFEAINGIEDLESGYHADIDEALSRIHSVKSSLIDLNRQIQLEVAG
jgi:hypothetical protein